MERHIFRPAWQVFVCDLGVRGAFADDYISLEDCESKTPGQSERDHARRATTAQTNAG